MARIGIDNIKGSEWQESIVELSKKAQGLRNEISKVVAKNHLLYADSECHFLRRQISDGEAYKVALGVAESVNRDLADLRMSVGKAYDQALNRDDRLEITPVVSACNDFMTNLDKQDNILRRDLLSFVRDANDALVSCSLDVAQNGVNAALPYADKLPLQIVSEGVYIGANKISGSSRFEVNQERILLDGADVTRYFYTDNGDKQSKALCAIGGCLSAMDDLKKTRDGVVDFAKKFVKDINTIAQSISPKSGDNNLRYDTTGRGHYFFHTDVKLGFADKSGSYAICNDNENSARNLFTICGNTSIDKFTGLVKSFAMTHQQPRLYIKSDSVVQDSDGIPLSFVNNVQVYNDGGIAKIIVNNGDFDAIYHVSEIQVNSVPNQRSDTFNMKAGEYHLVDNCILATNCKAGDQLSFILNVVGTNGQTSQINLEAYVPQDYKHAPLTQAQKAVVAEDILSIHSAGTMMQVTRGVGSMGQVLLSSGYDGSFFIHRGSEQDQMLGALGIKDALFFDPDTSRIQAKQGVYSFDDPVSLQLNTDTIVLDSVGGTPSTAEFKFSRPLIELRQGDYIRFSTANSRYLFQLDAEEEIDTVAALEAKLQNKLGHAFDFQLTDNRTIVVRSKGLGIQMNDIKISYDIRNSDALINLNDQGDSGAGEGTMYGGTNSIRQVKECRNFRPLAPLYGSRPFDSIVISGGSLSAMNEIIDKQQAKVDQNFECYENIQKAGYIFDAACYNKSQLYIDSLVNQLQNSMTAIIVAQAVKRYYDTFIQKCLGFD